MSRTDHFDRLPALNKKTNPVETPIKQTQCRENPNF